MITCPHCNRPLILIYCQRVTTAEYYYEDSATLTIEQQGKDVIVSRPQCTMNSDETVGDTLDQYSKAYCGQCTGLLEKSSIEALGIVIENVFDEEE